MKIKNGAEIPSQSSYGKLKTEKTQRLETLYSRVVLLGDVVNIAILRNLMEKCVFGYFMNIFIGSN